MDLAPADDGELLHAHAAGDPQAFGRLYDRYDRPCFQFIRRMVGSAHAQAAEDLHQETWISIANSAAMFDPRKAGFATWLFTIARRKVWDHCRRQKVAILASADDDAITIPDPGPTPMDVVQSRELAQRLISAIEALPLEQRSAFLLFTDAELPLAEVARVTGVTLETAKSRLRYARTRLRHALASERSDNV
jgi:RNA polymerase sigma factor (sigma-70 family)